MKNTLKVLLTIVLFFIELSISAQAPQSFSYQAVIRNASNQLISNQQVSVRISILQGSETGSVLFSEIHLPTTNVNGLFTIQIGSGTNINGSINAINWTNGPYFIQSETDPNGGNNYTLTTISQMMSVPYALYAENSGSSIPGPQGEQGPAGPQGPQGEQGPIGLTGPQGDPATDDQSLSVSATGDTLFLQNGGFVIIPGISEANNSGGGQTGTSASSCGATNVHNPAKTYGTMTDQEGNVYKTIVIGTQN